MSNSNELDILAKIVDNEKFAPMNRWLDTLVCDSYGTEIRVTLQDNELILYLCVADSLFNIWNGAYSFEAIIDLLHSKGYEGNDVHGFLLDIGDPDVVDKVRKAINIVVNWSKDHKPIKHIKA